MNPVVALLVFLVAAVATVAISLVVQQRSSTKSTHTAHPSQLREFGHRHPSEDTGPDSTTSDEQRGGSPSTRMEKLREARAAQLEAVADRERRYAERAEAQAQRLRESELDELGPAPRDTRARRAGVAPDDLDY